MPAWAPAADAAALERGKNRPTMRHDVTTLLTDALATRAPRPAPRTPTATSRCSQSPTARSLTGVTTSTRSPSSRHSDGLTALRPMPTASHRRHSPLEPERPSQARDLFARYPFRHPGRADLTISLATTEPLGTDTRTGTDAGLAPRRGRAHAIRHKEGCRPPGSPRRCYRNRARQLPLHVARRNLRPGQRRQLRELGQAA
jgi:hypothetical protein